MPPAVKRRIGPQLYNYLKVEARVSRLWRDDGLHSSQFLGPRISLRIQDVVARKLVNLVHNYCADMSEVFSHSRAGQYSL